MAKEKLLRGKIFLMYNGGAEYVVEIINNSRVKKKNVIEIIALIEKVTNHKIPDITSAILFEITPAGIGLFG